jgi:hypothetical protein
MRSHVKRASTVNQDVDTSDFRAETHAYFSGGTVICEIDPIDADTVGEIPNVLRHNLERI